MMIWSKVPWVQAEQILALLDDCGPNRRPAELSSPKDYFDGLVRAGAFDLAVSFLAMALPGREAIAWAYRVISETRQAGNVYQDILFASVASWLECPSDSLRRDIWACATQHDECSPERLLAGAVFFSGGSIAPIDQFHLEPPLEISGRLAGSAVIAAAHAGSAVDRTLREALLRGDLMASTIC